MALNKASASTQKKKQEPYIVERPKAAPVVAPKKVELPPIVPQQYKAVAQKAQQAPKLPAPTVQGQSSLKSLTAPKPVIPKVVLPPMVPKAATPKVTLPPMVPQVGTTRQAVPATKAGPTAVKNSLAALAGLPKPAIVQSPMNVYADVKNGVTLPVAIQRELRRGLTGTPLMPGQPGYEESRPEWNKNLFPILENAAPNAPNAGQMMVNEGLRYAYMGSTVAPRILADAAARVSGNEMARNIATTLNAPIDKLLEYQPTETAYIQDIERRGDERGPVVGTLTRGVGAIGAMMPSAMIGGMGAEMGLANLGRAAMALGASGSSANEAYASGATREQASARGTLSGALSYIVEGLAKGIPGLTQYSSLDKLQQVIADKLFANPVVNWAVQKGINIAGEGLEEVAEQFGNKFVDWATINGFKNLDLGTLDEYLAAGGMGMLVSGLFGGGSVPQSTATMSGSQAINPFTSQAARRAFDAQQQPIINPFTAANQALTEQNQQSTAQRQDVINPFTTPEQRTANEARMAAQQVQNEQIPQVQPQTPQGVDIASPEAAALIDRAKQRVREQISPNGSIRIPNALKAVSPELSQLNPIASVTVNPQDLSTNTSIMEFARRAFESVGFHMNRNGLGDVRMDQSGIANGAAHIKNIGDAAAFGAVADVIRDGAEIFHNPNHKGRGYETRLLAAPITVNGQDAMVGVIVHKTSDNQYYAHRLLTPDGKVSSLFETNNKQATISPDVSPTEARTGSAALPAVDTDSLSYAEPAVNDTSGENGQAENASQRPERFAVLDRAPLLANPEGRQAAQNIIEVAQALSALRATRDAAQSQWSAYAQRAGLTEQENKLIDGLLDGTLNLRAVQAMGVDMARITDGFNAKMELHEAKARLAPLENEVLDHKRAVVTAYRSVADEITQTSDGWNGRRWAYVNAINSPGAVIEATVPPGAARDALMARYDLVRHNSAEIERAYKALGYGIRALNLSEAESEAVQFIEETRDNMARYEEALERGVMLENNGTVRRAITAEDEAAYQANAAAINAHLSDHPNLNMGKIDGAIEHFRENYDALFQALNETLVSIGKDPIPYRRGYFPHFTEDGNDGLLSALSTALGFEGNPIAEIPTSVAGMSENFRPASRYFANAQQRHGTKTTYDAVKGFERYVHTALDIIYHSDDVRFWRALDTSLREKYSSENTARVIKNIWDDPRATYEEKSDANEAVLAIKDNTPSHLAGFAIWLTDYANGLAGKQSMFGRDTEKGTSRKTTRWINNLVGRYATNVMWMNVRSAISNLIPLVENGAEVGPVNLIRGMADTIRNANDSDGFVDKSDFLTARRGAERLRRSRLEALRDAGFVPMAIMDNFGLEALARARYYGNISRGMSDADARAAADAWTGKAMVDRSKGAMPTIYSSNSVLHRALGLFQVEVYNDLHHLMVFHNATTIITKMIVRAKAANPPIIRPFPFFFFAESGSYFQSKNPLKAIPNPVPVAKKAAMAPPRPFRNSSIIIAYLSVY
ncbi:MAG: hypothetical protein LBD02_01245 [Christensenellaceae bacterium]|jgi:hypothetical protein|nr:hypothetical protein [Christensenellaceae bacterium]